MHYFPCSLPIKILDYGCSYSVFLEVAKGLGAEVLGVDYSSEAVTYGRHVGVVVLAPSDLKNLDQRFDVSRFSHVLEHLINPVEVLQSLSPLLNPKGIVYITQPSYPVFRPQAFHGSLKGAVFPGHLHFFSPLAMVVLARNVGLRLIKFFTHENEIQSFHRYGSHVDYHESVCRLREIKTCGDH